MTQVFVSYKREDEARVLRLVRALEGAGLSVWWDRGLPAGESWRTGIESALAEAACVIVVWTRESVGPAGGFVRDEARHAMRRGALIPVLMDAVDLPLGFGEVQSIDLTSWKGRPRDPVFEDLVAAVRARIEGRPGPPARASVRRLMRRLVYGSAASAVVTTGIVLALNPLGVQDRACRAVWPQPAVSDVCGALGIGHRPDRRERLAWGQRQDGSCADLRAHIERFPQGVYRDEAARLLAIRRTTSSDEWTPVERRLRLFFGGEESEPAASEAAAQATALRLGHDRAENLCKGLTASTLYRFRTATPVPGRWQCERTPRGVICGFDGEAACDLEQRQERESERCAEP